MRKLKIERIKSENWIGLCGINELSAEFKKLLTSRKADFTIFDSKVTQKFFKVKINLLKNYVAKHTTTPEIENIKSELDLFFHEAKINNLRFIYIKQNKL